MLFVLFMMMLIMVFVWNEINNEVIIFYMEEGLSMEWEEVWEKGVKLIWDFMSC